MKRFLTATDKFGSINYEGINFFTNNIKRGSILKDGAFDWLTRSYFHSNSYFDSLVTAWQLQAQHVQVVSALISGNAQINGILTIGTLTISGSGSSSGSIVSSTGAIDFGGNNLLTTGKISVDSVTANQITSGNLTSNGITTNNITTDLLTSNHLTSDSITVHQATTTNLTSDSITSDYIITHNSATDTFNALNGTVETMHASSLHADTFSVAGTSTFSSLTDTTNGIALINKYGRLQRLNFSDNNSDVLFGNGSFGSLGTATGWQWYDTTVLLSTAPVVAVQNNLVVGGRVSIGAIRLSNGTGTDSMRTAQNFAIEAQKIFMRADTVNIKRRMEAKQIAVDTLTVTGITAGSMTASEMASPVGRIDTVISDRMRTAQLSVSGDIEALNGTVRSNEVTTQKIQSGLVETDSLDVNGSMHIKDSLKIGNSIWLGIKNQFTGANNSIYADNGPLYLQSLTHDLYLCGYNNNVMVGFNYCTTTPCNSSVDYPQRRLHITSYQDLSNSSNSSDKEGIRLEKQLFTNVPKFGGTLLQRSTWDFIPVTPVSSTPRLEINSVTGNKNIMTLTEAGNVGIGTNIPQKRMHIKQDDNPTCAASIRLEFDNSVPPNGCGTAHSTWDLNAQGDNVFTITNPSLAQPAMTFLGNGKVGIGTISPLAKLHIESQTGVSPFRITEGATTKFYISDTGSVGIGTAIPQAKLHVAGGNIMWGNSSILFEDQGGSIELGGKNGVAGTGIPYIDFHYNGLSQDYNARIINDANGRLSVDASTLYTTGNVGIGTTLQNNPNNYKLAVNGIIGGKDIWIESTSSAWPDYVLENDYIKLSIPALEAYLKRYKHLPGFLSAVEIKKKGVVSVGETQLLQQKMLEVYALYFIEVDKRITALEEENKILKKLLIEK